MSHRDEYRQWPFLTDEEFTLACAFFDRRYIRAELGPSRKMLKINCHQTATTGGSYIEVLRLLTPPTDDDELALALSRLGGIVDHGAVTSVDIDIDMSNEENDQEVLRPDPKQEVPPGYSLYAHQPYVTYEIHLHPTYRLPTLWFTLNDLPMGDPAFDLDSVYRYLVLDEYKSQLRSIGVTGGISAAPHPLNDLPAFFIHPCQTKEAMEDLDCTLDEYLMVWLGLVGGCVGLWVPPEMAKSKAAI
ncbi:hypothetical protein BJ875DRAFT_234692 [Amylocarpus encephaloides]|uniref:Ubiquitin-like-conjugating enzyme ATG10 n=1 Tax=Amylocarpus encephaloides TaxID=45428 RepID=A0A9P7YN81_9HELO|nr:hypothetical protein BJ875DRAFT_234692 [Amylocarpus encephaloides]